MAAASHLSHLLLCAGSVSEWAATTADGWSARLDLVARAAHGGGAAWATIVPLTDGGPQEVEQVRGVLVADCNGVRYGDKVVVLSAEGATVIIDAVADGRRRIADAVNQMGPGAITEQRLSSVLSAPAPCEPDLVVVLGDATRLPVSLVWELGYAELVFLNTPWGSLDVEHLEMAIDDFGRRSRRFGGVDS